MSAQEDKETLEIEIMQDQEVPDTLPVMPLKNFVLFPQMVAPLVITTEESKRLVTKLSERAPHFITALQRKEEIDEAHLTKDDIYRVGCVARRNGNFSVDYDITQPASSMYGHFRQGDNTAQLTIGVDVNSGV